MNRTLLKLPIISFLILLPVFLYMSYVSIYQEDVLLLEAWIPFLLLGSSVIEAMYLNRQMSRYGFRQIYLKEWAYKVEIGLTLFSSVMGFLCLVFGLLNFYFPSSTQSFSLLLDIWIMVLAVFLPLDITGLYQDKKKAIMLSAVAAVGFCLVFPVYMFHRPTHKKSAGFVVTASIIAMLVGLIFWVEGDSKLN